MKLNKKGFTLIELLAVVAILALLAVIAIPNVVKYYDEAETRSFIAQGQYLYKAASQQFVQDRIKTGAKPNGIIYDNVNNPLKLQGGGENLVYNIKVNSDGEVSYMDLNDGTWSLKIPANGDTSLTTAVDINNISKETLVAVGQEGGGSSGGGESEEGEIVTPDPDAPIYNPNTEGIPNKDYFDWLDEEENWIAGCFSDGKLDETSGTLVSDRLNCRIIADNRRCSDGKTVCPDSTNEDTYLNTATNGVYFSNMSSDTNGKGLYYTVDKTSLKKTSYTTWAKTADLNGDGVNDKVYYYRGAVANNYVQFAGALWQIIRIDERGNIRIMKETSSIQSKWNDESLVNNAQASASYMFGSASSPYANNSTVKLTLDQIYQKNFYGSNNQIWENFLADSGYCNDKGRTGSYYNAYYRLNVQSTMPSYTCSSGDTFTTSTSTFGNKAIGFNPMGMITGDEFVFSGGIFLIGDTPSYFLKRNNPYWTMSPGMVITTEMSSTIVISPGTYSVTNQRSEYVYPVISLKPTTKLTVASETNPGTKDNPYVVGPTRTWVD